LTPDLDAFTFGGVVDIVFRVDASKLNDTNSKQITLHCKELCIASASYSVVVVADGTNSEASSTAAEEIVVNVKATTVQFNFGTAIPADAAQIKLTVNFTGFLNNQMCVTAAEH